MGVDGNPWDRFNRPGSADFSNLIDLMRDEVRRSTDRLNADIPPLGQWCVRIMVSLEARYEHVVCVPFRSLETAMSQYRRLASLILSGDVPGLYSDLKVGLARTIGAAMAHADHQSYEHIEYMDNISKRGGESLVLGPILIAVGQWW